MILNKDSRKLDFNELLDRIPEIESISPSYLYKNYTAKAVKIYLELDCAYHKCDVNNVWLYQKIKDLDYYPAVVAHKYGSKRRKTKLGRAKQMWAGLKHQSEKLRAALRKTLTFYHKDGHVLTVEPQTSATNLRQKLREVTPLLGRVQGLARMLRNGCGTYCGWSLLKPQKEHHVYVKKSYEYGPVPVAISNIVSSQEASTSYCGEYGMGLNPDTVVQRINPELFNIERKPVYSKGGFGLKVALGKVMILAKESKVIIVEGISNLMAIAREAEISHQALRHLINGRCKTANGYSLKVIGYNGVNHPEVHPLKRA